MNNLPLRCATGSDAAQFGDWAYKETLALSSAYQEAYAIDPRFSLKGRGKSTDDGSTQTVVLHKCPTDSRYDVGSFAASFKDSVESISRAIASMSGEAARIHNFAYVFAQKALNQSGGGVAEEKPTFFSPLETEVVVAKVVEYREGKFIPAVD